MSSRRSELEQLLEVAEAEQDQHLRAAVSGRVRDLLALAHSRARVYGLRAEIATLDEAATAAKNWAKLELQYLHEFRQLAKAVIADELDELRRRVLEGDALENAVAEFPEKRRCAVDPSGTEPASSTGSATTSRAGSSTSP